MLNDLGILMKMFPFQGLTERWTWAADFWGAENRGFCCANSGFLILGAEHKNRLVST